MGITERREREKEQRRNDIIDAAEKLFFSRGLETTTMDEVAEQAELSKGTLYLYFKNKEDLYLAVNARGLRIMTKMIRESTAKANDSLEKIVATGKAYYHFYKTYPDYFNLLLYYEILESSPEDKSNSASECEEIGMKGLDFFAGIIKEAINHGSIRTDIDPEKIAVMLWANITGVIQITHKKGVLLKEHFEINAEEIVEASFGFITDALKSK